MKSVDKVVFTKQYNTIRMSGVDMHASIYIDVISNYPFIGTVGKPIHLLNAIPCRKHMFFPITLAISCFAQYSVFIGSFQSFVLYY